MPPRKRAKMSEGYFEEDKDIYTDVQLLKKDFADNELECMFDVSSVRALQEDMDDVFDQLEEYEETIDELEKQVTNLRVKVGSK